MADTQNFENHVRRTPMYYNLAGLVLLVNIIWSGYRLIGDLSVGSVITFLVSVALLVAAFAARTQTLTVQNRVIRLEQRLRFRELLSADVAARACELPVGQIVALRFASDAELPVLVNQVLAGQLGDPKDIKQKVTNWQGDFLRA
jgi:hypothetical protein